MALNITLPVTSALRILIMRRSAQRVLDQEHLAAYTGDAAIVTKTSTSIRRASRKKNELVNADVPIKHYRKNQNLKRRLAGWEADVPVRTRRLSVRGQVDESKVMNDLDIQIQQLTKLIPTSQSVNEAKCDELHPASPARISFDMTPYQLQRRPLRSARDCYAWARR
ncbi:hypothetical protein BD779DRAFT_1471660 [Infundibulicybe gibba]|nr:hypothetical protein BD779DRAFT_1471660 [Infundibulicybe gibba]